MGRTTVAALDNLGHLISQYEVTVRPSLFEATSAQAAIVSSMPGSTVKVQAQARGLLLSGHVQTPEDAAQAVAIAHGFLAENQTVQNDLTVQSTIQVTLRVRVAEMSRQVIKIWGSTGRHLGRSEALGISPL